MATQKKVLVITYYWPPCGGAGVQRVLKFVKYLPQFGIEPIVLTVDEQSAFYPVTDESLCTEIPPGIKIISTKSFEPLRLLSAFIGRKNVPQSGFSNTGSKGIFKAALRFIRGNFFIPDARVGWVKHAYRAACEIISEEKIDSVFISSPPHSTQLVGLKLKKKYPHIKWIADLRDPWTDIYYYSEMLHTRWAKSKDRKFETQVVKNADEVIVVSKTIKGIFHSKAPVISESKIHVIPNGFDEEDFAAKQAVSDHEFCISYTGTLGANYHPEIFFEALKNAVRQFPEVKFKLKFIGSVTKEIVSGISTASLSSVTEFIPSVTHEEVIGFMQRSTVLLLVIPEAENEKGILTGKLFEYLAARKPIICIGPEDGEAASIISECGSGKTFNRNNQSAIENYLGELVMRRKQNLNLDLSGREIENYSRRKQAEQLAGIIRKLAG